MANHPTTDSATIPAYHQPLVSIAVERRSLPVSGGNQTHTQRGMICANPRQIELVPRLTIGRAKANGATININRPSRRNCLFATSPSIITVLAMPVWVVRANLTPSQVKFAASHE